MKLTHPIALGVLIAASFTAGYFVEWKRTRVTVTNLVIDAPGSGLKDVDSVLGNELANVGSPEPQVGTVVISTYHGPATGMHYDLAIKPARDMAPRCSVDGEHWFNARPDGFCWIADRAGEK